MKLTWLFLRSRLTGYTLALLCAVAVVAWFVVWMAHQNVEASMLVTSAVPVVAACVIGVSTGSPFGETERATSYPLPAMRFGHLVGLLIWGVAALIIAAVSWRAGYVEWQLARNLAGFTGLALLAARVLGSGLSWVVPMVYGMVAFLGWLMNQEWRQQPPWWMWPMRQGTDSLSVWIALALLVMGLAAIAPSGSREIPGEIA